MGRSTIFNRKKRLFLFFNLMKQINFFLGTFFFFKLYLLGSKFFFFLNFFRKNIETPYLQFPRSRKTCILSNLITGRDGYQIISPSGRAVIYFFFTSVCGFRKILYF